MWKDPKIEHPRRGQAVYVKSNDKETVAFYCDGFYTLQLDPNLDVLRKVYITTPIEGWAEITLTL